MHRAAALPARAAANRLACRARPAGMPLRALPRRCRHPGPTRRSASQGSQPYEAVVLPAPGSEAELDAACQKLEAHVAAWLDEEWAPLEVHQRVAGEAAEAYKRLRLEGEHELGSILLGLSSSLLSFDFSDAFVGAFEVSNKVAELLMVEEGREVCCRSDADQELYERVEREQAADAPSS